MNNEKNKHKTFSRRAIVLGSVKSIFISCLIGRFYYLQILNSGIYQTLSNKNRLRVIISSPIRGNILDVNGKILANNQKIYSLILKNRLNQNLKNIIQKINSITVNHKISLKKVLKKVKYNAINQQIKLINNIPLEDAILITSDPYLTEIDIADEYIREYKLKEYMFHPIGYVSGININNMYSQDIPRKYNCIIGKDGIEKNCNKTLQGKPGIKKIEVDAKGRCIKKINVVSALCGRNIRTSINCDVQKMIWDKIGDHKGAILVSDLEKRKIIAMVSSPSIDPNIFINGMSDSKWKKIVCDKHHPLMNKCISFQYSPGSLFKIVMFLSILKSGICKEEKVMCTGHYKVGNRMYSCWKKHGHGYMNLEEAFINSCNVYFFHQSLKIGIKNISQMAIVLGLGQKTNINLPYELKGIIPHIHWKKRKYNKHWYLGDTINSSIGQGYVETTPIQLLQMISRIAIGVCYEQSIINHHSDNMVKNLSVNCEHLNILRNTMFKAVNNMNVVSGKSNTKRNNLQIAGKTGTSQVISIKHNIVSERHKDHSLFIGYAPFDLPKFAISTVIENGGWGSKTALSISKRIFQQLKDL